MTPGKFGYLMVLGLFSDNVTPNIDFTDESKLQRKADICSLKCFTRF